MTDTQRSGPYWVISSQGLLDLMYRVRDGEDPDVILLEEYANTEYSQDFRLPTRGWKYRLSMWLQSWSDALGVENG